MGWLKTICTCKNLLLSICISEKATYESTWNRKIQKANITKENVAIVLMKPTSRAFLTVMLLPFRSNFTASQS